ncbi:cupredoxin domain-containing protein [Candidatus Woesearchaeota archaeon]|nr:cupredoxin domain-containing protein [Candidatus Woesearchaeota archaeon]
MKQTVALSLILLGIMSLGLVAGCATTPDTTAAVQTPQAQPAPFSIVAEQTNPDSASSESVKKFQITAQNWEFVPNTIRVQQGDHVQLKIISRQGNHGFELPAFQIDEQLLENKEVVVNFDADTKGTFEFFCDVPCGQGHSQMSGTIIVE